MKTKVCITKFLLTGIIIVLMLNGFTFNTSYAQNVGINTNSPDESAMLDIVANDAGILIPRLTQQQRDDIGSPATGLMIYQTDSTPGFYYNQGTPASPDWVSITAGAGGEEWTDDGDFLFPTDDTDTCARVYENNPEYGFYYVGGAARGGCFVNAVADTLDFIGVYGQCSNEDYYGFGGYFSGGYAGAIGKVEATGSEDYNGLIGDASGGSGRNIGVFGTASDGANNYGVYTTVNDTVGFGLRASNQNTTGTGILTTGNDADGTYLAGGSGIASKGTTVGIYGTASDAEGSGIFGRVDIADGFGIEARNNNASGTGLIAVGNNEDGAYLTDGSGIAANGALVGVYGTAIDAEGTGIFGSVDIADGFGIEARNNNASGTGLIAVGNNEDGAYLTDGSGIAANGALVGVYGTAVDAGGSGIFGSVDIADGFGIEARNANAQGTGLLVTGNNSTATYLTEGTGAAISGTDGVLAFSSDASGTGLIGIGNNLGSIPSLTNGSGVAGSSDNVGVYGYGDATSQSVGIYGTSAASDGMAGYFDGDIYATGTANASIKNFVIDNPENPDEEVLRHTSIESNEAMVIYRGKAQLNDAGKANIELPSYFKALTKEDEATIQITCIGQPFNIGYEWNGDFTSFTAYGDANREVSWMVMADRDDPYMKENRKPVITKKDDSRDKGYKPGYYIHPELYGQPEEKRYSYLWFNKERKLPLELKETKSRSLKGSESRSLKKVSGETQRLKLEIDHSETEPKIKEIDK
ncbi:MAG: hypothetical protein ACQES1_03620 [Bacteroidota bacterium]